MMKRRIKQVSVMMSMVLCIACMSYAVTARDSYKGLQMYGYQGWFNCQGDGADKKWTHYSNDGKFTNGYCSIDFWPDVSEYTKKYKTPFKFSNGNSAYVFSSYDAQTVDVHFKWMRDYKQDGAFMQRFTRKIRETKEKNHYMKVFDSAVLAANKYDRALSIRYDITDCDRDDYKDLLADLDELNGKHKFFNRTEGSKTFLRHNGKPLIAIGGVGWQEDGGDISDRGYVREARYIIDGLRSRGYSILIRVPAHWRMKGGQFLTSSTAQAEFYKQIKRCDIIMPWHVGVYSEDTYLGGKWPDKIKADMDWCKANNLDYVPVVWPGFSRYNLKDRKDDGSYRPRNKGSFYWKQVHGALSKGSEMLFLAQFDEMDEGTQFFKCVRPAPSATLSKFKTYESDVQNDHYLWLAGESGRMLRKEKALTSTLPTRSSGSTASCHIDVPTGSVTKNLGETLLVKVSASDPDGVERVKVYMNNVELASDSSSPYEFNLPLSSAGTFTLIAKVKDVKGNYTSSDNSRTITVTSGSTSTTVPNVINQTLSVATTSITGAGLVVGSVSQENHATVAAGKVFSQTPGGGTTVNRGSSVALAVSLGPVTTVGTTVTFTSVAAHDGYVDESSEASNVGGSMSATLTTGTALRVGDTGARKQRKTFVSFNTASLPDTAVVTKAVLKLKRGGIVGTPTSLGALTVDIKNTSFGFGTTEALEIGDFQASASKSNVGTLSYPTANGAWATSTLNADGISRINKTDHTQFRVRFTTDDDNDVADDYLGFYSGDNATAANRPVLEVTYQ